MEMTVSSKTQEIAQHAEAFYDKSYTEMLSRSDLTIRYRRTYLFTPYINETHRVLDFGCGPGNLLATLPAKDNCGVEISRESRALAAAKGIDVRERLEDFAGDSFERIISAHALEHVIDPAEKLAQIRELLQPDGRFILVLPMNEWSHYPQRKWVPNEKNQHLYTWTPLLLGNLLKVCGFEPLEVRTVHFCNPPKIGNALFKIHPWLYRFCGTVASRLLPKRQVIAVSTRR
jgi:SAM-dependent methyltransferase